jgi:hypothetical protein
MRTKTILALLVGTAVAFVTSASGHELAGHLGVVSIPACYTNAHPGGLFTVDEFTSKKPPKISQPHKCANPVMVKYFPDATPVPLPVGVTMTLSTPPEIQLRSVATPVQVPRGTLSPHHWSLTLHHVAADWSSLQASVSYNQSVTHGTTRCVVVRVSAPGYRSVSQRFCVVG